MLHCYKLSFHFLYLLGSSCFSTSMPISQFCIGKTFLVFFRHRSQALFQGVFLEYYKMFHGMHKSAVGLQLRYLFGICFLWNEQHASRFPVQFRETPGRAARNPPQRICLQGQHHARTYRGIEDGGIALNFWFLGFLCEYRSLSPFHKLQSRRMMDINLVSLYLLYSV